MVPVREGGNSNWDGDGEVGELRFKNRLEVELTGAAVTTTAGGERKQKRRIDYVSWVSVAVLLWKKCVGLAKIMKSVFGMGGGQQRKVSQEEKGHEI